MPTTSVIGDDKVYYLPPDNLNGLLYEARLDALKREVPEAMKPRKIEIAAEPALSESLRLEADHQVA